MSVAIHCLNTFKMESPVQVLFVCLGNICRSPIAQGVFEHRVKKRQLSHLFSADSAGTSGWHRGERAHHLSIQIADEYNVDISKQRSRPVVLGDRESFDYFVAMDGNNQHSLINEFGFPPDRVLKIRRFDDKNKGADVPDPYGHDISHFDRVYRILAECTDPLINFLLKQNQKSSDSASKL